MRQAAGAALVVLALALGVVGGAHAQQRVTVSYWQYYFESKVKLMDGLIKQFEAQNAGIHVVQETFLDASRDFSQFRGVSEGEFVAWLKRLLAANIADTHRRFLGAQKRSVLQEADVLQMLDQSSVLVDRRILARTDSPSSSAVRHEEAVRLAAALERLRPAYHDVIILHHFQGLQFQKVADQLGRSLHSVKNLWIRGLIALKRQMKDEA